MEMLTEILLRAPIWVWPLLGLLIFLGFQASKPRQVSPNRFYFMPLMGLLSINSIAALSSPYMAWTVWAGGYLAGGIGAWFLQKRWLLARQGHMISVSGEWFTLLTMMLIFWLNFATGVMKAISPAGYESVTFTIVFALITGAVAGSFCGRAIKIIAYSRS